MFCYFHPPGQPCLDSLCVLLHGSKLSPTMCGMWGSHEAGLVAARGPQDPECISLSHIA